MKYINLPVYLNRFIFGATCMLYVTIFYGLYAQMILGAFQVLTGLILLILWNRLEKKDRKSLLIYWCFVILYGFFWTIGIFDMLDDIWVLTYVIIPLSIAGYFTYILESIKKKKS